MHPSTFKWTPTSYMYLQLITVIPVKPWTPEKISGMFIVLRPIRSAMKPQKITAKPQHALVTTWFETTSWLFLPTNRLFFHGNLQKPNYRIQNSPRSKLTTVQVFLLSYKKLTDRKSPITANYHDPLNCTWSTPVSPASDWFVFFLRRTV